MFPSVYSRLKKLPANVLVQNFALLGIIQSVNLLTPLLLTPYLIKTIGLANFGKIVFSQSVINILNVIIDYGFNLSATRHISINRGDNNELNKIFSVTIVSKILLLAVAFVILLLLLFIPVMYENRLILLFSFLISVGQVLVPVWAFQGLEKLTSYSLINVLFKILYIITIILVVKKAGEYVFVNLFLGIAAICTGVGALILLHRKYHFRFVPVSTQLILHTLKDGFHYFISVFSVSIYSYINSAILIFFTDYISVGIYGIVEKVMQIIKQVLVVYIQVVHPSACRIADKSYEAYKKFLAKAYLPFLSAFTIFCVLLMYLAPAIVQFFNASNTGEASFLLRIIIGALFMTCLNIPAYISLVALHFAKSYSAVLLSSSVLSIIFNIILTYFFNVTGCVINILITEFLIMAGLHLVLQFKHKQYALFNV